LGGNFAKKKANVINAQAIINRNHAIPKNKTKKTEQKRAATIRVKMPVADDRFLAIVKSLTNKNVMPIDIKQMPTIIAAPIYSGPM